MNERRMKLFQPRILIVGFVFLLSCCLTGCGSKPAINLSATKSPGILTDSLVFSNDSMFSLGEVEATLTLKYADRNETYKQKWSKWLKAEKKSVDLPKGFKGLQAYDLDGNAFITLDEAGKNHGIQSISRSWYAN
jgi:hypothetical protein